MLSEDRVREHRRVQTSSFWLFFWNLVYNKETEPAPRISTATRSGEATAQKSAPRGTPAAPVVTQVAQTLIDKFESVRIALSCPQYSYSATGSDNITSCVCNAGWTGTNGNCTGCVASKYKASNGSAKCTDCAAGQYSDFGNASTYTCDVCAAGLYLDDDRSECLSCLAYSYSEAQSDDITDCVCNASWSEMSVNCTGCVAGKYKPTNGSSECLSCPAYSYLEAESDDITSCVCNADRLGRNSNCTACVAGKYKTSTGSAVCTDCGAGKYSEVVNASTDTCNECAAGLYSDDDRSGCLPCPAYSYSEAESGNITSCVCNAGWSGVNSNCIACVAGKYKTNPGSIACTGCGAGKYSDAVNASTTDTCHECVAGLYSANDRSRCLPCPATSYSEPQSGDITSCVCNAGWTGVYSNCIACAAGKYKGITGSAICSVCRTDTFEKIKLKATSCNKNCQTAIHGTFLDHNHEQYGGSQVYILQSNWFLQTIYLWKTLGSNVWRFSDTVGSNCANAYFIWDGNSIKDSIDRWAWCGNGWSTSIGMNSVSIDGGPCSQCPLHSKSPDGSTCLASCLCEAGWMGANTNCIGCVAGKYKANPGYEVCSDCVAGKFSVYVNSVTDTCMNCTAGSYSNDQKSVRLSCPQNTYSFVQSDSISDCSCNAGWYGTNGNCNGCVAGKYKANTGSAECTGC